MKVALIIEYFPPFAAGGSEWSTYHLGRDLAEVNNFQSLVITPNYGTALPYEQVGKMRVIRFPFYYKQKKGKSFPSTLFYMNPVWVLWAAFYIYISCRKEAADVLHVNGKFSILPTRIANIFLRKRVVATIRDYQPICNYGFCIFNKDKKCDLKEYFLKDFVFYLDNYIRHKTIWAVVTNLIYAVLGRVNTNVLRMSCQGITIILLSSRQKKIFSKNGFKNCQVVYNSTSFFNNLKIKKRKKNVLFAGRLTIGKGAGLIAGIIPDFLEKFPEFEFTIVGAGPFASKFKSMARRIKKVNVMGQVSREKLFELISEAKLVIAPSLWPEPFGRVALEAISLGTPVVVSNKGGLPEIVKDGRYGFVVYPDQTSLLAGIEKGLLLNQELVKRIRVDYDILSKKFGKNVLKKYIDIYKKIE